MEKYMMKVERCCGTISLRTGTLIILWLVQIGSILLMVTNRISEKEFSDALRSNPDGITKFFITLLYHYGTFHLFLVNILLCMIGLYGIFKNNPLCIEPFLFMSISGTAIIFTALVCTILFVAKTKISESHNFFMICLEILMFISIMLIPLGYAFLSWYLLSIIYQFYRQMNADNDINIVYYDGRHPIDEELFDGNNE